jgi:hypothetical protein
MMLLSVSALEPSSTNSVASPPSSRMRLAGSFGQSKTRPVNAHYSASDSPL